MEDFIKSRIGKAVITGFTTAVVWAVCTPVFDLIFGRNMEWDPYRYIVEPIVIGVILGIFEYLFQFGGKKGKK